jgi:monoamine oxidase
MGMSRREFLTRVGHAGGYAATFATMQSLGLLPMKGQRPSPMPVAPGLGKGTKLLVLGGGIGGLVTAYEAHKLGYDVTLLEARDRPGGRNWTGRKGTVLEFVDGTKQAIGWEEGNYQNLGPARLPSTHWTILGYCRELKVPLEVEINTSHSTLLQNDKANGGAPVVQRKAANDTRGRVSELLSKCVAQGALDSELSAEDRERMKDFLAIYGPLDDSGKYVGSDRAGFKVTPGAGDQKPVLETPQDMHMLLDEGFWGGLLYEEAWDWQATMMQPVGGMDRIPYAFAKALGPVAQYNSPVTEIRRTSNGVKVTYLDKGSPKQIEASYCVVAMPFSILKKIPNDFSPQFKSVIDGSTMANAYKMPWEAPRFWETNYNIYGGLSFLAQGPSPVWYPSANLMSETGIIVGGYMDEYTDPAFAAMSIAQKLEQSKLSIEKLHPGSSRLLRKGIFMGWSHVKWNEGSWIRSYGGGPQGYETMIQADGPFYFAGDTISNIVGWQEGAALSARRAVGMISERTRSASLASPHGAAGTVA